MRRQGRPQAERGFALAAVLWLLAGLTVVVGSVSGITLSSAQRVAQLRERADFVASAYGSRAHLLYWLSGTGTDANSFTDDQARVRADGSSYQGLAGSTLQLQDQGGLVALNAANRMLLGALLVRCGVDGSMTRIEALLDSLEDYVDGDSQPRLHGAEHESYQERSLPPPRNAPLLSVGELWRVMGWAEVRPALQKSGCDRLLTAEPAIAPMPNLLTAPAVVLQALGVPDDVVRSTTQTAGDSPDALQARFRTLAVATGRGDVLAAGGHVVQRSLRVTHRQQGQGLWRLDYTLRLTPDAEGRPWQIVEPRWRAESPGIPAAATHADPVSAADPIPIRPLPDGAPAPQVSHAKKLLSF